jgi:hypothetical protein
VPKRITNNGRYLEISIVNMKKSLVLALVAGFIGVAAIVPQRVYAEATSCNTASCNTSANLNFTINIPSFLRLRIGQAGAGLDTITFSPSDAVVGDSSSVAGTGGDLTNGVVTAQIISNHGGNVSLDANVSGGGSGIGCTGGGCGVGTDFISWDEITTSCSAGTCDQTPPVLNDAGSGTATYTPTGPIVNENSQWTYSYDNTTVPVGGTYQGVVTYTATQL